MKQFHTDYRMPKFHAAAPEIRSGATVVFVGSANYPQSLCTVLRVTGYRVRLRAEDGSEFSVERRQLRLVKSCQLAE